MTNQDAQNYSQGPQPFVVKGEWFQFVGLSIFDFPNIMKNYISLELPKVGSKATYRLTNRVLPVIKTGSAGAKPTPISQEKPRIIEFTIQRVSASASKIPVRVG